jgi:mono/diheme cytochrome c family protein
MYNRLWKSWDMGARPDDFDMEVRQRYGLAPTRVHNPYPLPGEDPAKTNGGSGELPLGLIQGRDAQGHYNGSIGFTCSACHESEIGTPADGLGATYGRGNDSEDLVVLLSDLAKVSDFNGVSSTLPIVFSAIPIPLLGTSRGATEATEAAEALAMIRDQNSLDIGKAKNGFHPFHTSSGRNDAPMWWNLSHRARELVDGSFTTDNVRSELLLEAGDLSKPKGDQIKALEAPGEDMHAYMDALSPPAFPKSYDVNLAEAGAILFHTKDLWANGANVSIPKPAGNGSCASCHGVYSPRFAADPTMLPDPRLKGIAATIVPLETIGTDSTRARMVAPGGDGLQAQWNTTWFAYADLNPAWTPESYDVPGLATWTSTVGYLAPPLYGVWASTPYFHNGSVPTVWAVLKSADRPLVWRRQLTAAAASGFNRGYDTSLDAYDQEKLGWKYDVLNCDGSVSTTGQTSAGSDTPSLANCSAGLSGLNYLLAQIGLVAGQFIWISDLYLPPVNEQQVQDRMIYNSFEYSYGNGGHLFTDVLTDDERKAVIEYLKTL